MAAGCCPLPSRRPELWSESDRCPRCDAAGKTVEPRTVRDHVFRTAQVTAPQYRFCRTLDCPVLYYPPDGTPPLMVADVRTVVGCKSTSVDRTVCYCFGYTAAGVVASLTDSAVPDAAERIKGEVRAGRCRCVSANPSGRCCLGDVARAARTAAAPAG